jgi:hypothetical protein
MGARFDAFDSRIFDKRIVVEAQRGACALPRVDLGSV